MLEVRPTLQEPLTGEVMNTPGSRWHLATMRSTLGYSYPSVLKE